MSTYDLSFSVEIASGSTFNVVLDWTEGTEGTLPLKDYQLYRSIDSAEFTLLTTVLHGDSRHYLDPAVANGSNYSYKVLARDTADNASAFSDTVSLDVPA